MVNNLDFFTEKLCICYTFSELIFPKMKQAQNPGRNPHLASFKVKMIQMINLH